MTNDLVKSWGAGIDPSRHSQEAEEARRRAADLQARKDRVARANTDADFFCQYYLGHYFSTPLADWQHEVIEDDADSSVSAVPRGHGKTTLIGFGLLLRDLLRGASKFSVYIGSTYKAACERIGELRLELESNEKLLEDYGDLLKPAEGRSLKKAADDLELANGARVVARGAGQVMRGLKNKQHRPDMIVIDDIDKDQEVLNPDLVDKKVRWFKAVVRGLQGSRGMRVRVIGNIIARKTFLTAILGDKKFTGRVYRAIKEDGTPLMPALFSLAKLEGIREELGNDKFETEYQNSPPSESTRPFRETWLQRRWTREQLVQVQRRIVVAVDFSKGKTERSDYQAMIAVIRDEAGANYIIKADLARRTRKEFIRRLFDFCIALGLEYLIAVVLETNGFQEWAKEEIDEQSAELGLDLPIVEQDNRLNKYERICRLSPIAEGGRLLWPPEDEEDEHINLLRRQFELFPDDRHDDGPDATEMAVQECAARQRNSSARVLNLSPFDRFSTSPRRHT